MDVRITDASRNTSWLHNPRTERFIRNHPFFKNKKINDISYWDEDIIGDWSEL
jgi:hypothetical protein